MVEWLTPAAAPIPTLRGVDAMRRHHPIWTAAIILSAIVGVLGLVAILYSPVSGGTAALALTVAFGGGLAVAVIGSVGAPDFFLGPDRCRQLRNSFPSSSVWMAFPSKSLKEVFSSVDDRQNVPMTRRRIYLMLHHECLSIWQTEDGFLRQRVQVEKLWVHSVDQTTTHFYLVGDFGLEVNLRTAEGEKATLAFAPIYSGRKSSEDNARIVGEDIRAWLSKGRPVAAAGN